MEEIKNADLKRAYAGSYYIISGTGGDLQEWVTGYEDLMSQEGIGKPVRWLQTTGAAINDYAWPEGWVSTNPDAYPVDLLCLLFPLDDLHGGKLPLFKLRMQDRWFDDVIDNMRRR